ncbi:MAG: hypothetical protein JWO68_2716 [Actinomycetia bacterium]|nr:hypothetical protein [Actinomycetes bacterium]
MRLPVVVEELDPATVTELLQRFHPGARVAAVEVLERHELTNAHARLALTYDEPAGAPATVFAKLPPSDPTRRVTINATGMGRKEALFYATLAPALDLRTPAVHAAEHDADGGFALLLEDLPTTGCTVSDGTVGVGPDAAAIALEELAAMHVRYEEPSRRAAEAPWVEPTGPGSNYAIDMLRYGIEHHRNRLRDAFVEVAELYCTHRVELQRLWHAGVQTVVHGDPHLGNVFDDHGRTGFLDWGIILVSTPLRDVSYFLTMGMGIEDRRRHERDLLRHYLDMRAKFGGTELDPDDVWLQHRVQAAYTVPASCQVVLFPEGMTEARRVFSDAFLDRSMAAVEDLESRKALRQLGL